MTQHRTLIGSYSSKWRRRAVGPLILLLVASLGSFLATLVLPTWDRPGWLVDVTLLTPVVLVVLTAIFRLTLGVRSRPLADSGLVRPAPRIWVVLLATLLWLLGLVFTVVTAQTVLAAADLGHDPSRTTALFVANTPGCSRCATVVAYRVGPQILRVGLAGNISTPSPFGPGLPLAYDPIHPVRVMTLTDWSDGRGPARTALLVILGCLAAMTAGLVVLTRRRWARLKTLRPDVGIQGVRRITRNRGQVLWRVAFADGIRVDYLDSPAVRGLLRVRITANTYLQTVTDADRAALEIPAANGFGQDARSAASARTRRIIAATTMLPAVVIAVVIYAHHRVGSGTVGTAADGYPASGGPACLQDPGRVSPAADAYVGAVNSAAPARQRLSDTLATENGVVHRADLLTQVEADSSFLSALQAISFPSTVQPTAAQLITDIQQYDALLITSAQMEHGYYAAHQTQEQGLLQARSSDSTSLRRQLNLPPSNCSYLQP